MWRFQQNHCLPNIWKEFASGLTNFLVEKNLTSQTLQADWELISRHLADMYRLLPYGILGSLPVLVRQTSEKVACKLWNLLECFFPRAMSRVMSTLPAFFCYIFVSFLFVMSPSPYVITLITVPLRNKRTKTYAKYTNAHMPMHVYAYCHTRIRVYKVYPHAH